MAKRGKGKGPRAAKVQKVTEARTTRSSSADSHPQHSERNSEDGPSSSVIGREDVALVVEEVLKTLEHRNAAPSRPNQNGSTPVQETTAAPVVTS